MFEYCMMQHHGRRKKQKKNLFQVHFSFPDLSWRPDNAKRPAKNLELRGLQLQLQAQLQPRRNQDPAGRDCRHWQKGKQWVSFKNDLNLICYRLIGRSGRDYLHHGDRRPECEGRRSEDLWRRGGRVPGQDGEGGEGLVRPRQGRDPSQGRLKPSRKWKRKKNISGTKSIQLGQCFPLFNWKIKRYNSIYSAKNGRQGQKS